MTVMQMSGGPILAASVLAAAPWSARTQAPDAARQQPATCLASRAQPPHEYQSSTLRTRRVVIVGEAHRIKHDVDLVVDIIPRLEVAGRAGGFDVVGSPFAEMRIAPNVPYAMGYPSLRLVDVTDGSVWTKAIELYQGVTQIPLAEFAPDAASLEYVSQHNPFSDKKGLGRAEIEALWAEERAALNDLPASSGWKVLAGWQQKYR